MKASSSITKVVLALSVGTVLAGESRVEYGGVLHLLDADSSFVPSVFLPNWRMKSGTGGYTAEADGSYMFRVLLGEKEAVLGGRAFFEKKGGEGGIRAEWEFESDRDTEVSALCVQAVFSYAKYSGAVAECDGREVVFPEEEPEDPGFFRGKVTKFVLRDRGGVERLGLVFDEPTDILLQDNRRWGGKTVSMRVGGVSGRLEAGKKVGLSMELLGPDAGRLVPARKVVIEANEEWIPVEIEPEIEVGSALDFSRVVPQDAPAGKYGYAIAKGQHFEFEKKPGEAQRFYGVNFCFGANFVEEGAARRIAKHLARIGYNAVRFHHHDGGLTKGSADGTTLNPEQMKLFDGLVAACIEEGLYLTTDLYVSRGVPFRACGMDRDGNLSGDEVKMLVQFHEGVYQNYLMFARNFLTHVNSYTGRSYAEEPALSWIALVNEGNLGNYGAGIFKRYPEVTDAWKKWLAAKKQENPEGYGAVSEEIPENLWNSRDPGVAEFVEFLRESEERFARRTTDFLRNELKCRALTTNMSCWYFPVAYQVPRSESYGYVDDHFYVDHPEFLERSWSLPSRCPNTNPMLGTAMGAQGLVVRRVLDRPFTLTEYNYSAPGRFRGVGGIATGTAAALQNWAGLWRFAWSHDERGVLDPAHKPVGYFDMAGDPLSLAAERASICLFLRRDIAELPQTYAYTIPRELTAKEGAPQCRADWAWASWYAKVGGVVGDTVPEGALDAGNVTEALSRASKDVRAALGEMTMGAGALAIDSEKGAFLLRTPRTCGGFVEEGALEAGVFRAEVLGTAATVWASSLDEKPLRESSRILVTHLTDVQNSGATYADETRRILLSWGRVPHLMRMGSARISLEIAEGEFEVYALSTGGARRRRVEASVVDGRLCFEANIGVDRKDATFLYEIVRK